MPPKAKNSSPQRGSDASYRSAELLARKHIVNSESRYSRRRIRTDDRRRRGPLGCSGQDDSHLWAHSRLVAGLARRLALAEGEDDGAAYLAGLFHDAGKFAGGRYHENDTPEEIASAAIAADILMASGFGRGLVRKVSGALESLYREGKKQKRLADIVHDADFLAKSGRLGVAQFFIKSTLRGRDLTRMVAESLSRELTYAAVLPRNMRTSAGRSLASSRARETKRYFLGLLREIGEARGLRFTIRRLTISLPLPPARIRPHEDPGKSAGEAVPVAIIHPRRCERCGGAWAIDISAERGAKCDRLEATVTCAACRRAHRISFCLPELKGKRP